MTKGMRRPLVVLSTALLALVSLNGTSAAHQQTETVSAHGSAVSTDSAVNGNVRIWRVHTGFGYQIWAEATLFPFYGHFDFEGPGLRAKDPRQGETSWRPGEDTARHRGKGNGWACAYGWHRKTDGGYTLMGSPCIVV